MKNVKKANLNETSESKKINALVANSSSKDLDNLAKDIANKLNLSDKVSKITLVLQEARKQGVPLNIAASIAFTE